MFVSHSNIDFVSEPVGEDRRLSSTAEKSPTTAVPKAAFSAHAS